MGTRAETEPPPILLINSKSENPLQSSAAAFVEGGVQDACDDSCSICLEPFCDRNPATVTSCKHEYHLQCILEWAQRSKECPMCWQTLSLKDPISQELLDAVEQERSPTWARNSVDEIQFHQVPAFANYADFEERIMQHLAHQLARRGSLQNRLPSMQDDMLVHPSNHATAFATMEQPVQEARQMDAASHSHLGSRVRAHEMERHDTVSEPLEESQQRTASSDISSLSESLKSRFLVASSKCKETLTRTSRSFKERWRGRNNTTPDSRARAQEVSAGVVRQALKRISPESIGKENDVPTSSSGSPALSDEIDESSSKPGAHTRTRCTTNNHLEGVAANGVSPPSGAV